MNGGGKSSRAAILSLIRINDRIFGKEKFRYQRGLTAIARKSRPSA